MSEHWKTHRGDEWWFANQQIEADGGLRISFPKAIEINFNVSKSYLNEHTLYDFLCETSVKFPLFQIWIPKTDKLQNYLLILKSKNLIILKYFENPLSVTMVITNVLLPQTQINKDCSNRLTYDQCNRLKKLGNQIIENEANELKDSLYFSNPASIGSNEWMRNYKQISVKEKEYRDNQTTVYQKEMVGKDVLLNKVSYDFQQGYIPIKGYYLHCLKCGYLLLPMDPIIKVNCNCHSVIIDPLRKQISIPNDDVEVVKLIAIARQKSSLINILINEIRKLFK